MAGIDDVIARSRQPGGFVERRRFAVARSRAVEKLRRFALADPAYYILELIQGAVANGAHFVDVELSRGATRLSYVGGGFVEEELAQLFDFLFASKENLDTADVRQLALGLNALLLYRPDEIVLESGDGTVQGTTRVRIDGRSEALEVGRPGYALGGTFLRATGLHRGKAAGGSGLRETSAIEERCLTAPVPIVVNAEPVFGYGRSRAPRLLGYDRTLAFDEGDLYGTLGITAGGSDNFFKLLTWGVWLDSLRADILPGARLGGIVGFDRLHKTADHSAVVQDDRLQELWTRLRPYARMLREGREGAATHEIWTTDGRPLRTADIRETFRRFRTVIAVPRDGLGDRELRAIRASAISSALRAPAVLLGGDDATALRLLGGPGARVVQPDVDDDRDVAFYERPESPPPARPWLMSPVELEPLPVARLAEVLEREGRLPPDDANAVSVPREILRRIGAAGDLRAALYAPESSPAPGALWVELSVTERLACASGLASAYPGFVVRIVAPDVSPQLFLRPWSKGGDTTVGGMLSYAVVQLAAGALASAARRLLAGIGQLPVAPGSSAARIALAALARAAIKRLRTMPDGRTGIRFALLDPELPDALLALPILRTLDGAAHGLRDLEEQMESTGGLVYGVVREVSADLRGLDTSRILDLDLQQEGLLIALLGEASYVRVDARDVLAEFDGLRCRDVAFGLRPFPNFPLLVEGEDPSAWPEARRARCERALVDRLIDVLRSHPDEELRRQAVRHLLWYLYRRTAHALGGPDDRGVSSLPLFLDIDGLGRSFDEVRRALASPEGVMMYDGWSVDVADLGPLVAAASFSPDPAATAPRSADAARFCRLAMNPFALHLLSRLGRVRPTFDFDLSDAEALADPAPPETAYVAQVDLDDELVAGVIGVPVTDVADPAIAVVEPRTRRVRAMREAARQAGAVGRLVTKGAVTPAELLRTVIERGMGLLLGELARRIPGLPAGTPEHERCVRAGLRLAGRKVVLTALPGGSVVVDLLDPAARRMLELPLFPTAQGAPVSALRLLREFAVACAAQAATEPRTAVATDAPAYLREWLAELLVPGRIVRPASTPAPPAQPAFVVEPLPGMPEEVLARWLTDTMRRIHTDIGWPGEPPQVSIDRPGPFDGFSGIALRRAPELGSLPLPPSLVANADHWLVRRVKQRLPLDAEAPVWLLLACYAQLNIDQLSISNAAELEFQERVLELLERGELLPPDLGEPPQTP